MTTATVFRIRGIDDFLALLKNVKPSADGNFQALCPGHDDRRQSLSVREKDGRILIHCFAGCSLDTILKSLGLEAKELFLETRGTRKTLTIKEVYDYKAENGELLFQVVRYEPKGFRQRRPDGHGGFAWNLNGVKTVLYHLPEIINAYDDTIFITEGEKDCDALWERGFVATTSPGGAGNWKPEYADYLLDKSVIIIPDKDPAGFEFGRQVANSLQGKARRLRVVILPAGSKDVSDWLAEGGDAANLESMAQDPSVIFDQDKVAYETTGESVYWSRDIDGNGITFVAREPREERSGVHAKLLISCNGVTLAWDDLNLDKHEERLHIANAAQRQLPESVAKIYTSNDLRRDLDRFAQGLWPAFTARYTPEMMTGDTDSKPLKMYLSPYLLEGGGTILFAPPGRGKSNTALLMAVSVDAGVSKLWPVNQCRVLFINLERSRQSLRRRLAAVNRVLGLPPERELLTLNARGKSLQEVLPACRKSILEKGVGLLVLDSISRAGFGDLNENRPVNAIVDALSGLCDSWLALGHTPRASEDHVFGSIHFDAGADIVLQLSSCQTEDGTLGVALQITKANDIPIYPQQIWAYEFGECGLINVRRAKSGEFPELEAKQKRSMVDQIKDFILDQEGGAASATQIEAELGFNRANVSSALRSSGKFVFLRKEGRETLYGVKVNQ